MTQPIPQAFREELTKFIKRVFIYWVPISVILAGLGTLIGLYTIQKYTDTIGRPDLMAAAIDAKSALALWLVTVTLVVAAYLVAHLVITVLFGLTASLFNESPSHQSRVVAYLSICIAIGIAGLIIIIYKTENGDSWEKTWEIALFLVLTIAALHISKRFRLAVKDCVSVVSPSNPDELGLRICFLAAMSLLIMGTTISAISPAWVILKNYSGDETPEAVNALMIASIFSAILMLIPVVAFYLSNSTPFKRASLFILTLATTFLISINIVPGGSSFIVYKAASLMSAREHTASKFLITEHYAKEDFDISMWDTVEIVRNQPMISAFPLFSFGDALLLCPAKFIDVERKDWPSKSPYCIVTKNSKAVRMPKKASDSALPPVTSNPSK